MALYNARFAKPIPQNVLDLVRAKWEAASAEANGAEPLPPFKAFRRARPKDPHFPGLYVYRRATRKIAVAGNGLLLESAPEFAVEVALEHTDEEELIDELELRVEIVDSIVRTAAREEPQLLLAGFPEESQVIVTLDITEHVYGNNVPQGTKHIRVAALTLVCELTEE